MNQQLTIEKMKLMRLKGMAQTHHQNLQDKLYTDYTLDQYTNLLVDQEWEHRQNRKIINLLRSSSFRSNAPLDNIDYKTNRGLDKNVFERLASLQFIKQKENLIITGATGTGKSYLAQALGRQACIHLNKTKYFTTSRLMDEVKIACLQGTYQGSTIITSQIPVKQWHPLIGEGTIADAILDRIVHSSTSF